MKQLAMLALVGALQPCVLHAAMESVAIEGGKLGPAEPLPVFKANREHILVTGLPAGWSAGAGVCHTAVLGQYTALRFNFHDGYTTAKQLEANGYTLIGSIFPNDQTMLVVCRETQGNVQSVTAQVGLYTAQGGGIEIYSVYASNSSPTLGYSSSSLAYFQGSESQTFTAGSDAINKITITH